jgi:hypothetical protein
MRFLTLLGASALASIATPAAAQTTPATSEVAASPPAEAKALLLRPLTFVKMEDLDFGTIASGATAGTVTINPETGVRSTLGGVTGLTSAPGARALFAGSGTAEQNVAVISLTAPSDLVNTVVVSPTVTVVNKIPVVELTLDGSETRQIDPTTLAFYVGVGGTISVAADQPEGFYSAEFDITADYQ